MVTLKECHSQGTAWPWNHRENRNKHTMMSLNNTEGKHTVLCRVFVLASLGDPGGRRFSFHFTAG